MRQEKGPVYSSLGTNKVELREQPKAGLDLSSIISGTEVYLQMLLVAGVY